MRSSYSEKDVIFLLKDITGLISPLPAAERERLIQSGVHYSEMLPVEKPPSPKYLEAYSQALDNYACSTARAVGCLADKIMKARGREVILVSLARAGTPVGILLKRYIMWKYGAEVNHYAISIIRGKGIDENAVAHILKLHRPEDVLFVDGWIGKGAILTELEKSVKPFPGLSPELAVLADPANVTALCGTHRDILIPSSCLNSTVSGLVSRTFLRRDIIGPEDFHGAAYLGELEKEDLSYEFIRAICKEFQLDNVEEESAGSGKGIDEARRIAEVFGVGDINFVKPGIGETTRVLLRRIPDKVLIGESCRNEVSLKHILRLAEEKGVPVETYPLKNYRACGIIRQLADA